MNKIFWLDPEFEPHFPDTSMALNEPPGLLAAGGALSVDWLISAYSKGIFPWFSEGEPILWWSPAPRCILLPEQFHLSRSLEKLDRQQKYLISESTDFGAVIRFCAKQRQDSGTWITSDMINAYCNLQKSGFAKSIECWNSNNELVGGLYGVSMGAVFFGESMFSLEPNTSKLCLKKLIQSGRYHLIDCQQETSHLKSLGASNIARDEFEAMLTEWT
ncbi:MAG: leucyl/phenylalanyl-tRNA--protein transferase [Gammaproteobacteria bacterium]|jgi:leucyl/phenylalanyl-tRNA--protein transferase